jgi:hypothetical protein
MVVVYVNRFKILFIHDRYSYYILPLRRNCANSRPTDIFLFHSAQRRQRMRSNYGDKKNGNAGEQRKRTKEKQKVFSLGLVSLPGPPGSVIPLEYSTSIMHILLQAY